MNKNTYIKEFLEAEIDTAMKYLDNHETLIEEILELPNNCYGVNINDVVCKNENYKIELLTATYNEIGIMSGVASTSAKILDMIKLDEDEFQKFIKEQQDIKTHNNGVMDILEKYVENNQE